MKRFMCWLLLLGALGLASLAWGEKRGVPSPTEFPLPAAALCAQAYPGDTVIAWDGWGSDEAGQAALALQNEAGDRLLCMAEKRAADAASACRKTPAGAGVFRQAEKSGMQPLF